MVCPIPQGDHKKKKIDRQKSQGKIVAPLLHRAAIMSTITRVNTSIYTVTTRPRTFDSLLWSPYVIAQTIIFLPCDFYLSSFFFLFSSPNLSGHRLDLYHTSTHGVALVRIQNAGLKCAARGSLQIQDAKKSQKIAIWAPSHNFDGLYLRN